MADGLDLQDIVRRTVQANARLYKGWVDLSLEYFRAVAGIFGGEPEPAPPPPELSESGAGALVLEAEAGSTATGAFLVTNDLGRTLTCEFTASPFTDSDGNTVGARTVFDPAKVDLAPGQQTVVRATVPIESAFSEGVAYSGEFAIRGMDGFSVAAVVRRRHVVEASPIDRVSMESSGKPAGVEVTSGKDSGRGGARGKRSSRRTTKRSRKGS